MNINLRKKIPWILYHPFFRVHVNTKIEASPRPDIFTGAPERSWSLWFVVEFVCDELKPSEERMLRGLKGGTVLGTVLGTRFFQYTSKTIHWRYVSFLRILFLVFLIFEYSQAVVMPWRMTLPATFGMFCYVFIFWSLVWIRYLWLATILEWV